MKVPAAVTKGRLVFDSQAALAIVLQPMEGKRVLVDITRERVQRTNSQNAFYWSCVVPIAAHMLTVQLQLQDQDAEPVSNEEAHEALKRRFLGKVVLDGLEVVRSTKRLSTAGFSDYVELCRQWAAEGGYYVPSPDERSEVQL